MRISDQILDMLTPNKGTFIPWYDLSHNQGTSVMACQAQKELEAFAIDKKRWDTQKMLACAATGITIAGREYRLRANELLCDDEWCIDLDHVQVGLGGGCTPDEARTYLRQKYSPHKLLTTSAFSKKEFHIKALEVAIFAQIPVDYKVTATGTLQPAAAKTNQFMVYATWPNANYVKQDDYSLYVTKTLTAMSNAIENAKSVNLVNPSVILSIVIPNAFMPVDEVLKTQYRKLFLETVHQFAEKHQQAILVHTIRDEEILLLKSSQFACPAPRQSDIDLNAQVLQQDGSVKDYSVVTHNAANPEDAPGNAASLGVFDGGAAIDERYARLAP